MEEERFSFVPSRITAAFISTESSWCCRSAATTLCQDEICYSTTTATNKCTISSCHHHNDNTDSNPVTVENATLNIWAKHKYHDIRQARTNTTKICAKTDVSRRGNWYCSRGRCGWRGGSHWPRPWEWRNCEAAGERITSMVRIWWSGMDEGRDIGMCWNFTNYMTLTWGERIKCWSLCKLLKITKTSRTYVRPPGIIWADYFDLVVTSHPRRWRLFQRSQRYHIFHIQCHSPSSSLRFDAR